MSQANAQSAIIECKIKREGGSLIKMKDGREYHFAPDKKGRHVAVVDNMDHIMRFMQIPDAYTVVTLLAEPPKQPDAPVVTGAAPAGSTEPTPPLQGTSAPVDGNQPTQAGEPTPPSGQTSLPIVAEGEDYTPEQVGVIRDIFKAELGRTPHPNSKPETMVAQIEATRAARESGGAA